MASSIKVICGVCESQHRTTNAEFWCPECDEGLCSDCLKYHNALKATRAHEVILVEKYKQLPTSIANISHHCSEHDRKFQMYCPQHESICCPLCIHSNHANCVGILSLEKVIQTAKTSVLLESFDQDLQNIKMNIERVVQDRKQNLFEIQKQKQKFHDKIKQVRYKINEHLDTLEQQILQDLYAAEKKVKSEIEDLLGKLAENTEEVNAMENNISAIKEYASELQAFLGSKMIETEIQKHETLLQSLFDDGSLRKIDINCKIEDKITDVLSTVNSLGSISIEPSSPLVVMKLGKEIQAQCLQHIPPLTINDLTMTLQSKFQFKLITGCFFSSTGDIVLIDHGNHRLLILKEDGILKSDIPLSIQHPADGTCIDDKTVAVSFQYSNQMQIINVSANIVDRTIKMAGNCYGLCHSDDHLLYCDTGRGIQKVNMSDNCSSTLVNDNTLSTRSYVATYKDKMFYTNNSKHTVTCCSLTGEKMWEYKDQLVSSPRGIDVDKDSNVYIASYGNDSIIVLSSDGKQARKLLGSDDGISKPYGLAFDTKKENLLVANYYGPALYRLS
ncbi:transcription intermediary factor 1-alpha-like [Mytilus edulis]|uniref:transcription intermediary factor 1-alpha-like n=1 Tax=Mytilus edulis TaxID=6550 RepID=UPI0039EF6F14